jgi:hypothetical protein
MHCKIYYFCFRFFELEDSSENSRLEPADNKSPLPPLPLGKESKSVKSVAAMEAAAATSMSATAAAVAVAPPAAAT